MFHKMSIQLKLSLLTAALLSACCIGLTTILNYNAYKAVDMIQATLVTPALPNNDMSPSLPIEQSIMGSEDLATPTIDVLEAKSWFSDTSIFYTILIALGGGLFTYFIVGKALKPLLSLNHQVKNITVQNLSQPLTYPTSQDEIYELTTSFNKMVTKLNDAFLMQKQFSASVAHELRTPLTILQTKIDVFHKQPTHQEEAYMQLIDVVSLQSLRLRKLVETLLEMTNMDDYEDVTNISLSEMFEELVTELSTLAQNRNIQLHVNADASIVTGSIDLLYRAFYNLIENAIKYNTEHGEVQIHIQCVMDGQTEITIQDTGIGISDEHKEHIFEPFYRVDKSRSRAIAGVGLGLAFVKNVITKQGGSIEVLDHVPTGACFRVRLKK